MHSAIDPQERLTFLTRDYNRLLGLRAAPLYAILIATRWLDPNRLSLYPVLIAVAFCVVWYVLLNRYYRQHYGRVETAPQTKEQRFALWPLGIYALIGACFLLSGRHLPAALILLVAPSSMLQEGLSFSRLPGRRAYYIIAGILGILIVAPALIGSAPLHAFFHLYDFSLIGAILLVLSVLDHLLLVRSFHRVAAFTNA